MRESGEWINSETITVKVTADGDLAPVQIQDMPKQIALKKPLRGTIVPVVDAEWYSLSFGISRGDGEWEWFEDHDQDADNTTIDYDGHWFDEVGLYCLSVGAHAHGKNSSYTEAFIVVQPEKTEKVVTLSLGCETETLNCVAHTELPMVVIAPGALNAQYFDGYEWRGIDYPNNVGYSGSESFDGGDFTVLARAKFEEGEWIYSNPVIVHASMPGVLGVSNLTLASNHVKRGEPLVVSFTAVENASQYNVHIVNEDGQGYSHGFEPGTHKLSTSVLEEGTYTLIVNYCGSGYAWRSVEQTFTVTGAAPEEIVTFLGADEIKCNEKVLVSVYAPDANRIRIYEKDASNDEEWLYEECEGDRYTRDFFREHPATVYYSASVSYDEGETWSERVEIGTLRVTESPQLDKPEIKLSSSLINAGENVVFSFAKVDYATRYWYELRDNDALGRDDYLMDGRYYVPASVKLPASLFRAGHTYRLDVHVGAPGYETHDARYSLAVRPDLVDGDSDINLYVNGETESVEGWVSDGFHVVADAPESATAIIVADGMDWRWQKGNRFEDDFGYDFNGEVALIARYTEDKIDPDAPWWETAGWAGYSNPVTLTIHSYGNMPEVEAKVPESVTRGEWLEISVDNADTFLNEEAGYENLWLHAEAYSPDEDRGYGCFDWDGKDTILLPTAELEAGGTYELHVRAGAHGWAGSTHVYQFSVTEAEDGDIVFAIDKTEVVTCEDFTVSVYAPGADQVKLFERGGEIDCRDGAVYAQMHSHGEATELRFHAEAHMPDTDKWVRTETITVTVKAPYGSITADALGLTMPTRLKADQALTIAWNDLGLQNYDVTIDRERDGVRVWHSWNNHGETETTIPVEMPQEYEGMEPVLEPGTPVLGVGEFYRVNLDFQRYGWNSLHIEKQIVVVRDDMYAEGLTLMVDGQTEACTTLVNVDVPVRITAPQNATAILVWNGYDWEWHDGSDTSFHIAWGDANERLVYAKYTTEKIVDGKDWWEYNWSGLSNIVSVNVTRNGYVEAPVVELSSAARSRPQLSAPIPSDRLRHLGGPVDRRIVHACDAFVRAHRADVGPRLRLLRVGQALCGVEHALFQVVVVVLDVGNHVGQELADLSLVRGVHVSDLEAVLRARLVRLLAHEVGRVAVCDQGPDDALHVLALLGGEGDREVARDERAVLDHHLGRRRVRASVGANGDRAAGGALDHRVSEPEECAVVQAAGDGVGRSQRGARLFDAAVLKLPQGIVEALQRAALAMHAAAAVSADDAQIPQPRASHHVDRGEQRRHSAFRRLRQLHLQLHPAVAHDRRIGRDDVAHVAPVLRARQPVQEVLSAQLLQYVVAAAIDVDDLFALVVLQRTQALGKGFKLPAGTDLAADHFSLLRNADVRPRLRLLIGTQLLRRVEDGVL